MAKKVVRVWLPAFAVVLGLSASVWAQSQQQKPAAEAKSGNTTKDKGPSLDETMNWIVNSLSVASANTQSDGSHTGKATYEFKLTRTGACSIHTKLTKTYTMDNDAPNPLISESNANLANFDSTSVTVRSFSEVTPGWTRVGQEAVALSASTTNNQRTGDYILFYFYSELANRGKAALIHAIELCGGKKSTF